MMTDRDFITLRTTSLYMATMDKRLTWLDTTIFILTMWPGVSTYAGINCADNTSMPLFANNQIYNPTGETAVCGIPLAKWQSMGNDPGTQVHKGIPTSKDILQFATIALNA
eukprot:m.225916 g.225916  ORF g.225916 m.225916 type:complete len:111 (-) comp33472_c0_seq7:209-541(-)